MSWKHWTAVLVVIGIGIVLQIPRHEREMAEHDAGAGAHTAIEADPQGPYRTVALEVTGMT